jgi:hypothetical protein
MKKHILVYYYKIKNLYIFLWQKYKINFKNIRSEIISFNIVFLQENFNIDEYYKTKICELN